MNVPLGSIIVISSPKHLSIMSFWKSLAKNALNLLAEGLENMAVTRYLPQVGAGFRLPQGWQDEPIDQGFLLTREGSTARIVIMTHPYQTMEELAAASRQPITGEGTAMNLMQEPLIQGNSLVAQFQGLLAGEATQVYSLSVLSPHGGGLMVMGSDHIDRINQALADTLHAFVQGVEFVHPQVMQTLLAQGGNMATPGAGAAAHGGGGTGTGGFFDPQHDARIQEQEAQRRYEEHLEEDRQHYENQRDHQEYVDQQNDQQYYDQQYYDNMDSFNTYD